ncbi:MAG: hypothetical protein JWQ49_1927 [Edaphobacter sp.]|nr:hypothetical protein [Edaphobacter sp.]
MPTLYGQTEAARGVKSSPPSRNWDQETVFNELEARYDNSDVDVARSIANWMKTHADKIIFGHGKVDGSMTAMTLYSGEKLYPLTISTQGKVYINFVNCKRGPFQDSQNRLKWLAKSNEISGLSLTPDCIDKMPPVAFSLLSSGARRPSEFIDTKENLFCHATQRK